MTASTKTKKRLKILVFTTPTCPHCRATKQYLRQRGIPFKEIDVSRDRHAARDMVRRSGQSGVPVIDINGKIVVGFNRPKIDKLLGLR
jgi:glutaredoxin-like YruB-family protein